VSPLAAVYHSLPLFAIIFSYEEDRVRWYNTTQEVARLTLCHMLYTSQSASHALPSVSWNLIESLPASWSASFKHNTPYVIRHVLAQFLSIWSQSLPMTVFLALKMASAGLARPFSSTPTIIVQLNWKKITCLTLHQWSCGSLVKDTMNISRRKLLKGKRLSFNYLRFCDN